MSLAYFFNRDRPQQFSNISFSLHFLKINLLPNSPIVKKTNNYKILSKEKTL